jgi:hypothetical protein
MSIDRCFHRTRLHPKTVQHSSGFQKLIFILKLYNKSTESPDFQPLSFFFPN